MLIPTPHAQTRAARYIRMIRNHPKKEYAKQYWNFLTGARADEPKTECSGMAAQAVRNRLSGILKGQE